MRYVKYTPPDRATLPSLFSPAQQCHHRMLSAQQPHATKCPQYPTAAASARSCPQPIAAQSRATPRFHCRRKCGRVCCQKSASCARNESVTTHAGCVELTCTYISSPVNHSKFTTPEPPRTYKSVSLLVSDIPLMAVPKVLMLRQQVEVRCCHAAKPTHSCRPTQWLSVLRRALTLYKLGGLPLPPHRRSPCQSKFHRALFCSMDPKSLTRGFAQSQCIHRCYSIPSLTRLTPEFDMHEQRQGASACSYR